MNESIFDIEIVVNEDSPVSDEQKRTFNKHQNRLALLYGRLLNSMPQHVKKIRVEMADKSEQRLIDPPDEIFPLIHILQPFDFEKYFSLQKHDAIVFVLENFQNAINAACTELNYDCQPFHHAYEKVKDMDYQNEYIHGKLKSAPNRRHKAGIHIRVEEEYAAISTLMQDKEGNETARIALLRTLPHYMFIYKFIHHIKWLDKDRFLISDKSGQVMFSVNVPEEKAEMQLLPKTMTLPELVQEVTQATVDEI